MISPKTFKTATISAAAPCASRSRDRARISRHVHSTIPNHSAASTAPVAVARKSNIWLTVSSKSIKILVYYLGGGGGSVGGGRVESGFAPLLLLSIGVAPGTRFASDPESAAERVAAF